MANNSQQFWVYILLCSNNNYYTGYTTDLARRYAEHKAGSLKCKYTRSFSPVKIEKAWKMNSKSQALKVEAYIKGLSKNKKRELILSLEDFSDMESIIAP